MRLLTLFFLFSMYRHYCRSKSLFVKCFTQFSSHKGAAAAFTIHNKIKNNNKKVHPSITTQGKMFSTNDNDEKDTTIKIEKNDNVKILGITGGIGSGKSLVCKILSEEYESHYHIDSDSLAHTVYAPNSKAITQIVQEFGAENVILEKDEGDDQDILEIDRKKLGSIVFQDPSAMSVSYITLIKSRFELYELWIVYTHIYIRLIHGNCIIYLLILFTHNSHNIQTQHFLQKLEQIVWPFVKSKIFKRIYEIQTKHFSQEKGESNDGSKKIDGDVVIVVEAAVLLDAEWFSFMDAVWMVVSSDCSTSSDGSDDSTDTSIQINRLVKNRGMSEKDAKERINAQKSRRGLSPSSLKQEIQDGSVTAILKNGGSMNELRKNLRELWNDKNSWKNCAGPK